MAQAGEEAGQKRPPNGPGPGKKGKPGQKKRQAPTPQAGRREEEPPLEGPQEEKGAGGGKEENTDREPTQEQGERRRQVASGRRARVKRSDRSLALW